MPQSSTKGVGTPVYVVDGRVMPHAHGQPSSAISFSELTDEHRIDGRSATQSQSLDVDPALYQDALSSHPSST